MSCQKGHISNAALRGLSGPRRTSQGSDLKSDHLDGTGKNAGQCARFETDRQSGQCARINADHFPGAGKVAHARKISGRSTDLHATMTNRWGGPSLMAGVSRPPGKKTIGRWRGRKH